MNSQFPRAETFFRGWAAKLPDVAANLTTAAILFVVSLGFKPVREWLFPDAAAGYPLICTAEAVQGRTPDRRTVEFYLINRTADEFTFESLQTILRRELAGTESSGGPEIRLRYDRDVGRVEFVAPDASFNRGKGELQVSTDVNDVSIVTGKIAPRAILRVLIGVADLPETTDPDRSTKSTIPFDYEDMQDSCYGRT